MIKELKYYRQMIKEYYQLKKYLIHLKNKNDNSSDGFIIFKNEYEELYEFYKEKIKKYVIIETLIETSDIKNIINDKYLHNELLSVSCKKNLICQRNFYNKFNDLLYKIKNECESVEGIYQ